ncbi:single-stranded-DNA-specific exonuclease RecJ [Hydrogenimonas sp.]|nr:single-stranded-DNA-specific exonuclease RecJ [Hydrogenimonas sp.]
MRSWRSFRADRPPGRYGHSEPFQGRLRRLPALLERIDADLIITVDNGIGAFEVARGAKGRGIDLIITDHHTASEILPDAYAIVNPKKSECVFAYPDICGAQVAWFLVGALKRGLGWSLRCRSFSIFWRQP